MFTEGEPEFCPEANKASKASFLGMFMQIDRRFMGKCFGQMQELGIYPGQIPVLGLLAHRDGLSQKEIAERASYQTAYSECNRSAPGKSRISLQKSR